MKMKVTMKNYRRAADALLGVRLGSIFLTTGVVKFVFGIGIFTAGLQQQFADKLPIFMVRPFAYALPFVGHLREKIGMPSLIHAVRHVGYTVRELS
jgi:hypothetical protein